MDVSSMYPSSQVGVYIYSLAIKIHVKISVATPKPWDQVVSLSKNGTGRHGKWCINNEVHNTGDMHTHAQIKMKLCEGHASL